MAKEMRSVYLDLDGVLADFVGGAIRLLGLASSPKDMTHWDSLGKAAAKQGLVPAGEDPQDWFWSRIDFEGPSFWAELDALPEGMALLTRLLVMDVPVCFVTAPSRDPASAAGKMEWLERNVPNDVYLGKPLHRRFALCPTKHLLAHPGAILVDDRYSNVQKFAEAGGVGLMWPQPWSGYTGRKDVGDKKLISNFIMNFVLEDTR